MQLQSHPNLHPKSPRKPQIAPKKLSQLLIPDNVKFVGSTLSFTSNFRINIRFKGNSLWLPTINVSCLFEYPFPLYFGNKYLKKQAKEIWKFI